MSSCKSESLTASCHWRTTVERIAYPPEHVIRRVASRYQLTPLQIAAISHVLAEAVWTRKGRSTRLHQRFHDAPAPLFSIHPPLMRLQILFWPWSKEFLKATGRCLPFHVFYRRRQTPWGKSYIWFSKPNVRRHHLNRNRNR